MPVYLHKALLILLYLFCTLSLLSMALGIPGIWILVAVALVFALATHFTTITWFYLLLCLGLAILGEIVESFLGVAMVARKGGGRYGILGTFIGGLAGVIVGAPLAPPFGSIILGFAGAFAGAVAGEYIAYKNLDAAMRVGWWAFLGRALAIVIKLGLGFAILWIIVVRTW